SNRSEIVHRMSEHPGADRLEMRLAALDLQRDGMEVAKPALERARGEHRAGTRRIEQRIDKVLRLMNRVRRGEPDTHALVYGESAGLPRLAPRLFDLGQQESPPG